MKKKDVPRAQNDARCVIWARFVVAASLFTTVVRTLEPKYTIKLVKKNVGKKTLTVPRAQTTPASFGPFFVIASAVFPFPNLTRSSYIRTYIY